MTFRDLRPVPSRPGLFLHADAAAWSGGLPDPAAGGGASPARGRGDAVLDSRGGVTVLVKRPRRGGLLRGVLPSALVGSGRSAREAEALERLSALGLAPRCLGLQLPAGPLGRATVAVEYIDGARDLLALAAAGLGGSDARALARAAGRAVRGMHDGGVCHRDLNAANVVARAGGGAWRAWIVDLDDARLLEGPVPPRRRVAEILRLCRSLDKWRESAGTAAAIRAAFVKEALPKGLALRALRAARRRHRLRAALGRAPRPLREGPASGP